MLLGKECIRSMNSEQNLEAHKCTTPWTYHQKVPSLENAHKKAKQGGFSYFSIREKLGFVNLRTNTT